MINLFIVSSCPHCRTAKRFFELHRVSYQEFDVENNPYYFAAMQKLSHQNGVPVVEIGEHVVVGFHPAKYKELLGIKDSFLEKIFAAPAKILRRQRNR